MKRQNHLILTGLTLVAIIGLALAGPWGASAKARSISVQGGGINVSISFNTQMPLGDTTDQTLVDTQKRGRTFVYRMAREECALLKATIAETCRLTSLNVNSQLRNQHGNKPVSLYINGSARYLISLKKF
jgi:hypothetical protein